MYATNVSTANRREFRMSPKPFVEKRLAQCRHQLLLGVRYIELFGALRPNVLILGPSPNTVFGNQIKDEALARLRCYRCFGATCRSHLQGSSSIHGDGREVCTPRRRFRPDPARKLSANLYDLFSEKLLMTDTGTVRNM